MPDPPRETAKPQKQPWKDPSLNSERESEASHDRRAEGDAKREKRQDGHERD